MALKLEHQPAGGRRTLVLTGNLDAAARDGFCREVSKVIDTATEDYLVLDVAALAFVDSSGLGAIVELTNQARARGLSMVLRRPSPQLMRLLRLTGLADVLSLEQQPKLDPEPG